MKALTQDELTQAVRTLALLARRGFPLAEGLSTLESSNPAWVEVKARVQAGDTVGQALRRYPHIFSEFFASMVESAENSPQGESILSHLSQWLEVADEVRRKVKEMLHYPFLLLSFLMMEAAVLVGVGLPTIIRPYIYVNQGGPPDHGSLYSTLSYVLLFLAGLSLFGSVRTLWLLPLALRVPSFRATVLRADQALWARAVASHLQGGRSLRDALVACADIVWSTELKSELATLPDRIQQGDRLSQALSHCHLVDAHLRWSVTAGEAKEELSGTLIYAAEQLESDLLVQCRAFFLFLQPCAIALIGLMTAAVLGSFWWSMYHSSWNLIL